jgi:SAM-dependent methyltransferase
MELATLRHPSESLVQHDGIPVFLRFSDVERELAEHPKERRAVELARAKGWRHALETLYDAAMLRYSADPGRSRFLDVLPLDPDMTVLEVGVGFGQHTAAIAKRVARVDSLEVRLVNALFARIRCEQEGVTNATFACGGDDCRLPFPDASYDAVLLNLVLEWCASGDPTDPASTGQQRLLSEAQRVLKPGGWLQVNTKNRFAWRILTGGRDEHADQTRFGSALPRALLRLLLRLRGSAGPRGHLYSWGGLRRRLRRAGFARIESYWTVPEMRFPEHFVPVDARSIRAARPHLKSQGPNRRTDLLMRATPAWLVRHVAPGLFFLAQKP